jgi:hypothetical protein
MRAINARYYLLLAIPGIFLAYGCAQESEDLTTAGQASDQQLANTDTQPIKLEIHLKSSPKVDAPLKAASQAPVLPGALGQIPGQFPGQLAGQLPGQCADVSNLGQCNVDPATYVEGQPYVYPGVFVDPYTGAFIDGYNPYFYGDFIESDYGYYRGHRNFHRGYRDNNNDDGSNDDGDNDDDNNG